MLPSSMSYVKRIGILKSETGTGRLDSPDYQKIGTTRLDSVGTGFPVSDLKPGLADWTPLTP